MNACTDIATLVKNGIDSGFENKDIMFTNMLSINVPKEVFNSLELISETGFSIKFYLSFI